MPRAVIFEHDETRAGFLRTALSGFELVFVGSQEDLLLEASVKRTHLLIIDTGRMSRLGGIFQCLSHLRQNYPDKQIKVLLIDEVDETIKPDLNRLLQSGADEIIHPPLALKS